MTEDRETPSSPDPSGTPKMSVITGGKKSPAGGKGKTPQVKRSAPDPETGLTEKQEAFVQAIVAGNSFATAYREAYNTDGMADGTIHSEASKLGANPKVTARLNQIRAQKEQERRAVALSRDEYVLNKLKRIIDNEDEPTAARVRSLELMGKTIGLFVDRVETEDKTDQSIEDIEARIKAKLGMA
jgi:hypothetical protein